jgi:Ca2+-binding EF-hand superfamily protein
MRNKILLALLVGTVATAAVVAAGPGRHGYPGKGGPHSPALHHGDTDGDGAISAAEWQALFARLDANSDGQLSGDELPGKRYHRGLPAAAIAGFIAREADADGDGAVTLSEFEARVAALDSDGDGALSMAELHARRPGAREGSRRGGFDGLPPFLSDHDTDGDGKLSLAELQVLFEAADADGDGSLAGDELGRGFRHRHQR